MAKTYDVPTPFAAVEDEHGCWTIQGHTPNGPQEWWLIEEARSQESAERKAALLNKIVEANT